MESPLPVQLKIIENVHGCVNTEALHRFLRFVLMHKPDVVAMEMLPLGDFDEDTAESVTQFYAFGDDYEEAARNMVKDGVRVVGVEQKKHRPFLRTIGGVYRNTVLRSQGVIEQDWLDSLALYRGKKVVVFCNTFHARVLKTLLGL